LPGWSEVSFERHSLWAAARATVATVVRNDEQLGAVRELQVEESIGENRARETQLMSPGSGYLLQRSRLTSGKNTRLKEYRYAAEKLVRIRREPDSSQDSPPARWPVSSRRDIPYPAFEEGAVLTSMPALLLVAGSLPEVPGEAMTVYVQVDPVGTQQGDPEFSLLGLGGQVSILLDEQTGLPLRVRGRAPRIGKTYIDLVTADIRPTSREQRP
jgi:hypothetical protein